MLGQNNIKWFFPHFYWNSVKLQKKKKHQFERNELHPKFSSIWSKCNYKIGYRKSLTILATFIGMCTVFSILSCVNWQIPIMNMNAGFGKYNFCKRLLCDFLKAILSHLFTWFLLLLSQCWSMINICRINVLCCLPCRIGYLNWRPSGFVFLKSITLKNTGDREYYDGLCNWVASSVWLVYIHYWTLCNIEHRQKWALTKSLSCIP